MKIVAITGVAGFIGSSLAEKLLQDNFKVIGIDSFTDYYPKKIKENNIKTCLRNENFHLVNDDLFDLDLVPIFKKCQYIFHMSAQPGVRPSWGSQFQIYVKENILVTQRILEAVKNIDSIKKIIVASSSSVYGEQEGKMNEENTQTRPISPYGVTKLAVENLCQIYGKNFNLPIISLRYFTVYGPRQRPEMAFMRFIINALTDKPVIIYGDGNQRRDFTYVDNIVGATLTAAKIETAREVINIGGGKSYSINEIITIIEDILKKRIIINYKDAHKGDMVNTQADISKAKKFIGYKATMDIHAGITNQIEYVKKNKNLYLNLIDT